MNEKTIDWVDLHREPQEPPNPHYLNGIDLDCSTGKPFCQIALPYPAKRCGFYEITCECGVRIAVTTAGRADDPRSVKIACRKQ
jgi:hypothetical protein